MTAPRRISEIPPADYGRGRRCSSCAAFLCRYNPGPDCWPCQGAGEVDVDELRRELGRTADATVRELAG